MNNRSPDQVPRLSESLEHKLVFTLCTAAVIFSIVAGAAQFTHSYRQEVQRNRATLDSLAVTVHSSASIAAFVGNEAIANDVIEGLLRNSEILAVNLESNTGYHVFRWKNPKAPEWHKEDVVSYQLLSPTGNHEPVGTLSILTDARLIASRAQNAALLQLGTLILQTIVLGLIMLLAFRRLIGRPLSNLTQQLHTVVPGTSQRVDIDPEQNNTEIGVLAASLNGYLESSENAIVAERELRVRVETMENHYRRIFESTNVGVMVLKMNGALISCNAVLRKRILRSLPDAASAEHQDILAFAFKQPEAAWTLVEQARSQGSTEEADLELRQASDRQQWVHCLFSIHTPEGGKGSQIECVLYDVTSRREREKMAIRSAERDALTDIVNRRGAERFIERAIADAHNVGAAITVFYIDLDGFKKTNDTFGHAAGDQVLIEVTERFGSALRRSSDLLARIGGDEFLIVAYDCNKDSAIVRELCERLIASLADPIRFSNGGSILIGASVGIAGFPEDG
ncbi:MAG TPA: diguanylate cyclase, partial [Rhodocyclaceae bacterium]|nr:diguanylate cyclase [Rhodocyclaceae bacterium]